MKNLAFAFLVLFLIAGAVDAQSSLGRDSLRGLHGFEVVIEKIASSEPNLALTDSDVRTDVELRLRKAGIRVLSQEEASRTGAPFIDIAVTTLLPSNDSSLRSYFVSVELTQLVQITKTSVRTTAITYKTTGYLGMTGRYNFRAIRETVGDQLDIFLNDYLAMNPKSP